MTDLFATSRCPWGLPEGQVNQPERRAPIARNDRSIVHFTGNIFRLIDDPVDSWTVDTLCSLSELLEDLLHKRFTWLSVWVPADLLCLSDKGAVPGHFVMLHCLCRGAQPATRRARARRPRVSPAFVANLSNRQCGRRQSIRRDFTPRRSHKSRSVRWSINDERVKFLVEITGDDRISWQLVNRLVPWQP
jgi:hypothetical protein